MQQELTDDELLALLRNPVTKEKAFISLVNQNKEKLYRHIRRLLIIHQDTDDVLQNVFIKVWRHIDNFRGDSKLFTWLYRIATNESISFLESRKKAGHANLDDEINELSQKITSQAAFNANSLLWKLQLAIQQLPEQQKLVFNLRYFDEMPYSEISKILNVSEGSLKASYHHAAKKIEAWLLDH